MSDGAHPASTYSHLLDEVRDAGLLRRRHGYYAGTIIAYLTAFAGAWVAFAFLGDTWWQLLIASLLAVIFAQLAFVGHDADTNRSSGLDVPST